MSAYADLQQQRSLTETRLRRTGSRTLRHSDLYHNYIEAVSLLLPYDKTHTVHLWQLSDARLHSSSMDWILKIVYIMMFINL